MAVGLKHGVLAQPSQGPSKLFPEIGVGQHDAMFDGWTNDANGDYYRDKLAVRRCGAGWYALKINTGFLLEAGGIKFFRTASDAMAAADAGGTWGWAGQGYKRVAEQDDEELDEAA